LRIRILLSAALVAAALPVAAAPRLFSAESLLDWQFAGDARISPDGKRIAYVHVSIDRNRDTYNRDLWLAQGDAGPRQLTSGTHDDEAPRWSPDGTRLAFASNRSGKRQVHVFDLEGGGEPWQLTADTEGVGAFAWSPDGQRIVFTSSTALAGDPGFDPEAGKKPDEQRARPPFVTERLLYRNDGTPGYRSGRRSHLWLVAADRGAKQLARRITSGDFDAEGPAWSSDGKLIYFSAVRREDAEYRANDSEIFSVTTDGEPVLTALTSRHGPDEAPSPSPDGKWLAYTGFDDSEPPRSSSVTHLYVMRTDGSQSRQLATGFDRNVGETLLVDAAAPRVSGNRLAWSADSRRIYLVAADRGQSPLFAVDVAKGEIAPVTTFAQGELREFSLSRNGVVAGVFSAPTQPGEVVSFALTTPAREDWRQVSRHAASLVPEGGFAPYEELSYDSFDGRRIQGWMIKPPGYEATRRYPTILYIHGGPHAMYGTSFFHEFQVLAASGFVVLITNPRGSTGYGGEFANVIQYRYPGDDFRDLMAGVDLLIARGIADPERLGVAGGSGGGLLTSWTVGQTDRFKAAVVERAVTNWHSFVGTSDLNYYFVTHWFKDFPWRDSADYLARSPLSQVDKVNTPVLVIHNEADYRTALDQGLQFYAALKMLKKPARLAVFPDSSHGMSREGRPSQRVERLKLIEEWFAERLK
jgi:dipeptidyl aminopeptidase/acylaminoacyl peptidase